MATDIQVIVQDESGQVTVEADAINVVTVHDEQQVVVEDQVVFVVSVGEQGPPGAGGGGAAYPWNVFRNEISVGETCVVPADSFLLGVESFIIGGTLDNHGKVLIL